MHCDNHLDTLGVDLLALLVPVDDRLGIAGGLAHKRCHAARHADLVGGNLGEFWGSWEKGEKKERGKGLKKDESANMKIDTLPPRGHQKPTRPAATTPR